MLPLSQFSYRRSLEICEALITLSHRLQVALDRGMEGRPVQLDLAEFDRVSHCSLLYKLRSIEIGGQFLSIVSEFNDRKQRMWLDGKINAIVAVVSGVARAAF